MGKSNMSCYSILIWTVLAGMVLLAACDKTKTYTVGFINIVPDLDQTLEGFKEGMTALGYIEGQNIRYVYDGATTDMGNLPAAAQALVAEKVDLILSITTPGTKAAQQATADNGLPVVFAVVTDPVRAGIVDSLQKPGGNITGIATGIQERRRLEWLVKIAPGIRQIYVPFNPKDQSPVLALKIARNAAEKLGVKLITHEIHNAETLNDAVLNIPPEADAVFLLPDSLLSTRLPDLVSTATKLRLPTSAANVSAVKSSSTLTSFGFDQHLSGKQASRLVDQVFKGTKPADLPMEIAELYLSVNLKTAKAIGLTIPDDILRQAHIIIR